MQVATRCGRLLQRLVGRRGSDGSSSRPVLLEMVRRVGNNFAIAIAAVLGEPSDNRRRFGRGASQTVVARSVWMQPSRSTAPSTALNIEASSTSGSGKVCRAVLRCACFHSRLRRR